MKLTVHRATKVGGLAAIDSDVISVEWESYFVTVTNASPKRDIVVTHVWFDTVPPVDVDDVELPVRLAYSEPWETSVPVDRLSVSHDEAVWLARCSLSPDNKIVKSRPNETVRPAGRVPRKGASSTSAASSETRIDP